MLRTIFLLAFVGVVWCSGVRYEVPEPSIEVFAPKGFRISIQDSRSVEEVQFIVTVPGASEPLVHRAYKPDRGHWAYWNPDVVVRLYEKIRYKLIVKYLDLYCQREGVYIVQRVVGINDTDCEESAEGHKVIAGFTGLDDFDRHMGRFGTSKSSNFQSSYSMYKDGGMKPITKSSTSTTSGTFYLKPSGVMEGSGYKSGSTFDSTKNEGEQWHHYRSQLTAEELDEIRKSGLRGLDLAGKLFPGGLRNYDERYLGSEFKNFPDRVGMADGEVTAQFHETHESSSFSQSKPTLRFKFDDLSRSDSASSAGGKSETSYKFESANHVANPQPQQTGGYYKSTEYHREEHSMPGTKVHIAREPATQKLLQVSHTKEYSSHSQPVATTHAFPTLENRQDHVSRAFDGSIFKYYKSSRPRYPDECVLLPGSDYSPSENVRHLEKSLYEMSCLSSLFESTTRKDLEQLRQEKFELKRKIELLERKFIQFETSCKCY